VITESSFDDIISTIRMSDADIIIVDSLSVLSSESLDGTSGSMNQLRTMTEIFMQITKTTQKSIILIGHVTKDGSIGGPKALEHLVDIVLFLE
jgi:DNA repair protein RadA/Sms